MKKLLTLSLLTLALSMTAGVATDEKPCCKQSSQQPCCKSQQPCCKDTTKTDTLQLHMEKNQNPQL